MSLKKRRITSSSMDIVDSLVVGIRVKPVPPHIITITLSSTEMVRKIMSGSSRSWEPVKEKLSKRKTRFVMTLVMITQVSMCVGGGL